MLYLNLPDFIVPEIETFIRTDEHGHIDSVRSRIYILYIVENDSFCLLHTFQRI